MPDKTPLIRVTVMPADTNPYGGVFGGWLMHAFKRLVENLLGMLA
jgi:acyl-CoA hydrolase